MTKADGYFGMLVAQSSIFERKRMGLMTGAEYERYMTRAGGLFMARSESAKPSSARIHWAQLLARIYEVIPLLCPACGGPMRILAFLVDPPVVRGILAHLALPHRPPPLAPARAPPQGDFLLDERTQVDPAEPEPAPEFVFDPSLPDVFDD